MHAVIARRLADIVLPLLVIAAACYLLVQLVGQVCPRIAYPWDLLMWSESPFMTNMLKLRLGEPLYGPTADANSFVYSPGLEWICYALLRPLGLDLDVRWCRGVTAAIGLAAAACMTLFAWRMLAAISRGRAAWWTAALILPVVVLIFFRNLTADVCHPDNLHGLHLALTCLLGAWALRTRRFGIALTAIVFGATGVLAKQTGALGGVGMALALAGCWHGRREKLVLLGVGALSTAGVTLALLSMAHARFWLLDLLRQHPFFIEKVCRLPRELDALHGGLYLLAGFGVADAFCHRGRKARELALVWLAMGLEVLPSLMAFGKEMGAWNNLGVIDLWAAGMALPALLAVRPPRLARAAPRWAHVPGLVGVLLLLSVLMPERLAVPPTLYRYGARLDRVISRDLRRNQRILLAHGTTSLIHAGFDRVPRDRANSILELRTGNAFDDRALVERLSTAYYDRIYINSAWYGRDVEATIERWYQRVGTLEPAMARGAAPAYKRLLGPIRIYEPRGAALRTAALPQDSKP